MNDPAASLLGHETDLFRRLIDAVRDYAIFMLDPSGHIATWNPGAERIKGYTAEEIIGQHFSRFYEQVDIDSGKPEHELRVAAATGRFEDEGWRVRKDGTRFWANVILSAVRGSDGQLIGFAKVTRDLTQRRKAEEQLRANQDRLAVTLNSIGDAVITTDAAGRIERMNPVAERLTGWRTDDAFGRDAEEVFRIVNERTRQSVDSPIARVIREGIVVGLANHTALIARDGTERAIADSGAPIRGTDGRVAGVVLVFRDVTAERAAESKLRESEERFRLLVDSVKDHAIFMLDTEGRVQTWNTGAERIKGWHADEIIGRSFACFYPDDDIRARKPEIELRVATAEGRFEEEAWRLRKDGTRFWASVILTAVRDERGELRGFAKITRDLTDRRAAEENARALIREQAARAAAQAGEEQLRASEESYRRSSEQLDIILRGVADGITVQDATGRFVFINDAAARIFGFRDAAVMLEAGVETALDRFELRNEHGEPLSVDELPGRRALRGDRFRAMTVRVVDRDTRHERWLMVSASAVLGADGRPHLAINIWHDVTEPRRAEQQSRFLAEATAVLASSLELELTVQRLAELTVPQLGDQCTVEVLGADGRIYTLASAHAIGVAALASPAFAAQVARSGSSRREGSTMVVPLVARGRAVGAISFIAVGRNYSAADLALAEDIGRRAGLAVDNARLYKEAQDAIRARDEFLLIASHELRTPCTSLQLQVESLLRVLEHRADEGLRTGRIEKNARAALQQTLRLNRLIEELLDVSRIASHKLRLDLENFDLAQAVREVCARFDRALDEAHCRLELRTEKVGGRWDRLRIEQVITNLLANAVKYGRGKPVELAVVAVDGRARLTIIDRGIGISAEDQARIFDPFERAVSVRHYGGFGLGLWISRMIVEAHGGTIRVVSAPGEGATFTIELPRDAS